VILFICATYLVLGCLLESLSMVLLTIPIFFPIVHALGFDPIWFGVLVVVVVEISMITPPVGMNVFVLKALLPEIPITTIFRGLVPFIMVDVLRLALFITVPSIILFLPSHMK
jgi:TRAP-type C4-dicarboxylate transport system permease large subunit